VKLLLRLSGGGLRVLQGGARVAGVGLTLAARFWGGRLKPLAPFWWVDGGSCCPRRASCSAR
jgi:hypothetical protein